MPEQSTAFRWTILGPIAGLLTFTLILALGAWHLGWYPSESVVVVAGFGAAIAAFAVVLLLRQARHRSAAATAASDARARVVGILESAMDPIISVDEAQRIVLFNTAAERVFRWPRTAVIGQPLDVLIPDRFRGIHSEHIRQFGETGVTSRRVGTLNALTALRANGEEFPIEAAISQHVESDRKLFTVILRDITERMDAEAMLAQSEARLRGILDSAMDAIVTVDERQHIVLFNSAAEAMFGCAQSDALGAPLSWFIPVRFRDAHGEHVHRFGEAGVTSRRMGALRLVTGLRRNGEEFPIDASISQLDVGGAKFFTVILRDVTERVVADQALLASKEELQQLASSAHEAREQEQSRIARELHDELGQSLTALRMMLVWVRERVGATDEALTEKLQRMGGLLDDTVAAMRRISSELRPLILDDLGVVPALESLVENFTERTGIPCELTLDDTALELDDARKAAVFRIVQESLTNIAKHARASRAEVVLTHEDNDEIALSIIDNGTGFIPGGSRPAGSRGILGMRERAYLLGGRLDIRSAPDRGTTLEIRLPLHHKEPAHDPRGDRRRP